MRAIWNGAIIAESSDTVVIEGNHYFPPESVRRDYLNKSAATSWKILGHPSRQNRLANAAAYSAPAALRPCRFATPLLRSAQATQHAHKWLDGVSDALAYGLQRSLALTPAAIRPRLRLPGTTRPRFAFYGERVS